MSANEDGMESFADGHSAFRTGSPTRMFQFLLSLYFEKFFTRERMLAKVLRKEAFHFLGGLTNSLSGECGLFCGSVAGCNGRHVGQ